MTTRKCERYAGERHANAKSFHACVFLLSNSEKLRENIQNNPKQNNTKIWAAYGQTARNVAIKKVLTFEIKF